MKIKILGGVVLVLLVIIFMVVSSSSDSEQVNILSEKEAIAEMIVQYPQLAVYQKTDLPPSSIESKQGADGWYLGFIKRGSGVPGVLEAECYYIDNDKTIILTGEYKQEGSGTVNFVNLENCTADEKVSPLPPVTPPKEAGLKLDELGSFGSVSIRPLSIEEDSRCPVDVTCIQAGTVRLKIEVVSDAGTDISIVKLGQEFLTDGFSVTLANVTPNTNSKINIAESEYFFNFTVTKQEVPVVLNEAGKCYRGGCSSQICSDQPDMVSTCEYREEYACYQSSTCERQANGQCGWTKTPELLACLDNSAR